MFGDQLTRIENQKNKAYGIFNKTRDELLATVEKAAEYIAKNSVEIEKKEKEIEVLAVEKAALATHINSMMVSVQQIEAIIK